MRGRWWVVCGVLAGVLAGCSCAPAVSDTGYVGTWARGNDRATSTIAIAKDGEQYRFRWTVASVDGKWKVRCDWEGNCEEFVEADKVATYKFDCWFDSGRDRLMVKMVRTGTERSPDSHTDIDVLELEPGKGGTVLWSHTIQRDDRHFEPGAGPTRYFTKVSNAITDPPPRKAR